jgi:hypothetical protein
VVQVKVRGKHQKPVNNANKLGSLDLYIDATPPAEGAIVRFIDWPGRSSLPTYVTWLVPDK